MAIVEVGMMGVQPNKTPMDPSTPDGAMLNDAWKLVTTAPGGPQKVCWGVEVDDPSKMWSFFDWESLEQHQEFAKSFGGEATKRFGEVFTPGFTKHAFIDSSVLGSPVTEVMLAFFPSTITAPERDRISDRFGEFHRKALRLCNAVRGVSSGWGCENDFPIRGEDDGEKTAATGSLFIALIGWGTVDEHMAFRETEEFKENVDLITGMEGCVKLDMFHIRCEVMVRAGME